VVSDEERDRVRQRLLELAEADPEVRGAAVTGSHALGTADAWSDIDLAFGVAGPLDPALARWTELLERELDALHHWDLPFGPAVYRVFLLPSGLEVDLAFIPAAEFGPRAPTWRTVFGQPVDVPATPPPARDELVGLGWHHVLHARACIERRKPLQALHWISGVREQALALACLRLDLPVRHLKGADGLPAELTAPLEATLPRSLEEPELRRALGVAMQALLDELERWEPELAARLEPVLRRAAC
jgi:predicted nucleotidyltransferase